MNLALLLLFIGSQTTPDHPVQPRRLAQLEVFEIKCAAVTSGAGASSFSLGGAGVTSSTTNTAPAPLNLANTADFADGLGEVLKSKFADRPQWLIVEKQPETPGGVTDSEAPKIRPQFLITAAVIDMNVSASRSGVSVAGVGGGENRVRNKVVLDLKLLSPDEKIILETVRGTGVKSTKSNFLGAFHKQTDQVFGYEAFQESPLAEACDLAIKDALDKLNAKLAKYPWEAEIALVREEKGKEVAYLNVSPDCGLKLGTELDLIELGEPIRDAKTGRMIGRTRPTVHGKVKVADLDGDLVIVEPLPGTKMKEGWVVRLPAPKK